ncbi:hypothetical protein PHYC_00825 [Phycisphaerales bacterium]|nr:hypothetical protein PHYC_00825 [Phycisphaerales bacterium]
MRVKIEEEAKSRGSPPACRLSVKVVPGSRKSQIVGVLGDRLKIKVAAPPEDGRANRAMCELLAGALGISSRGVSVIAGLTHPEKTVRVEGLTGPQVRTRLGV